MFHGYSFFSLCTSASVALYEPQKKVSSDSEPFLVPNLPGEIKLSVNQLVNSGGQGHEQDDFSKFLKASTESELTSFGVVVNSFYELEPAYADHYRNVFGRKS